MPKGFSLFIVPEVDIVSAEGFLLLKGEAYGLTGGTETTELVAIHGRTGKQASVHRKLHRYKSLTRDEAKEAGYKLPTKYLPIIK